MLCDSQHNDTQHQNVVVPTPTSNYCDVDDTVTALTLVPFRAFCDSDIRDNVSQIAWS